MNIKKIAVFIIFICIFLVLFQSVIHNPEYEDNKAKFIWIENDDEKSSNTWACFRNNFYIDNIDDISDVVCNIAVDSKYWLYINGEIVVRDGGLKRGENTSSIYYDEIKIDEYLRLGLNNISVLVWYYGKDGFSHVDSGQGAFLFETKIGNNLIVSNESWKATRNLAYLDDEENLNSRLSESNIYYDSNLEIDGWFLNDYDDSSWDYAVSYGEAGDEKWGELIKRDIPFFKYSDINEYLSQERTGNIIEVKLPYNMQLVPYLKVNANANEKIIISNNENFDNSVNYGKVTYITKNGLQEFESPSWINGDKIYYSIPDGIEVISLGYRETGYDAEIIGSFSCDDNLLNELWEMASRTLYVNMRDTYMDCPDRERAMWIGDTSLDMEEAMYSLDTSANALYEKCIKTFIGWQSNGVYNTVAPSISARMNLPVQNLLAISAMYDYYNYTGNEEFLRLVYPSIKEYLKLWNIGEDGIVSGTDFYYQDIISWYDSQGLTDDAISENIWYYYALKNTTKITEILNLEEADFYRARLERMKKGLNEKFWDGNGYKSDNIEFYDARLNSIAIISGLADEEKYESIVEEIKDSYDNSVFMEKYILEALSVVGKTEIVQERIKDRYSQMVNDKDYSTTLWEYWDKDNGGKNHAWAGGPLVIMSKYFAGISPLKPGYSEISIKPDLGNLNSLKSTVDTVKGPINIEVEKKENALILEINTPEKTLVAIPKMTDKDKVSIDIDNENIYKDGYFIENDFSKYEKEDDKYIYIYIKSGKYSIKSR